MNITVWKDGSYLYQSEADDHHCQQDADWLCSVPLVDAYAVSETAMPVVDLMAELKAKLPQGAPVAWRYRLKPRPGKEPMQWKCVDRLDECNPLDAYEREPLYAAPATPSATRATESVGPFKECAYKTGERDHDIGEKR